MAMPTLRAMTPQPSPSPVLPLQGGRDPKSYLPLEGAHSSLSLPPWRRADTPNRFLPLEGGGVGGGENNKANPTKQDGVGGGEKIKQQNITLS